MNVLICGGSSGIGKALAQTLVREGHRVALMARSEDALRSLDEGLNAARGGSSVIAPGDIAEYADCQQAVEIAVKAFGQLDAVVNTAGDWVGEPLHETDTADVERFIDTDVRGAVHVSRAALPYLQKTRGRLIHVNGLQGFHQTRQPVMYATVEAAVTGLCRSLRWEAAKYGVHVGVIHLGAIAKDGVHDAIHPAQPVEQVVQALMFMLNRPGGVNVDEMVLTPLQQKW